MIGDEARRRRRTPCARVSSSVAPHTPVAPVSTQLSNYRQVTRPDVAVTSERISASTHGSDHFALYSTAVLR